MAESVKQGTGSGSGKQGTGSGSGKRASSKETAAELREWNKLVEELPELIHPLDLPDEVQIELFAVADRLRVEDENDTAAGIAALGELAKVMPLLFADAEQFEEWRKTIPVFKRLPMFQTIYAKYVKSLGE